MAGGREVLSQAELDALMDAVAEPGFTERTGAERPPPGPVESYDLASPQPMAERHLPVLAQANERFRQRMRFHLHALLSQHLEIAVGPPRVMSVGEYLQSLPTPASINLLRLGVVPAPGLVVFEPDLIDAVVDQFFGGAGSRRAVARHDFTPAERRVIRMLVTHSGDALRHGWGRVGTLECDFIRMEVDPRLAAVRGGDELVTIVVSPFTMELPSGAASFDVCLPIDLLGLARGRLAATIQAPERPPENGFKHRLEASMQELRVELTSTLAQAVIPLQDLMSLRVGDVVPVEVPATVTLNAGNVPLYRGTYGVSDGRRAIRITQTLSGDPAASVRQRQRSLRGGDHE